MVSCDSGLILHMRYVKKFMNNANSVNMQAQYIYIKDGTSFRNKKVTNMEGLGWHDLVGFGLCNWSGSTLRNLRMMMDAWNRGTGAGLNV